MKAIGVMAGVAAALALAGCGEKVVDGASLIQRDGLWYEPHSEEPFTGRAATWHENGQQKAGGEYENGKPIGKIIFWDEEGRCQGWIEHDKNGVAIGKDMDKDYLKLLSEKRVTDR